MRMVVVGALGVSEGGFGAAEDGMGDADKEGELEESSSANEASAAVLRSVGAIAL